MNISHNFVEWESMHFFLKNVSDLEKGQASHWRPSVSKHKSYNINYNQLRY
jgi:hypothetical protein